MNPEAWQCRDRFLELHSPWLTLIGEHLKDSQGQLLQYWRVEKADSAIILPIQNQQLILPPPTYRPGVGELTLDFPGGRVPSAEQPLAAALAILQRELGVPEEAIVRLVALNSEGWAVNSSFSNQKLYGFVAELHSTAKVPSDLLGATYPTTKVGIQSLVDSLTCLQCRAVLLQWWLLKS
ncbi:MAG: NUDIX hydrolase [Coleofasciculus sp. S288]|nr:NUDIX hydrolase [Coleofasciculus sp. S288]